MLFLVCSFGHPYRAHLIQGTWLGAGIPRYTCLAFKCNVLLALSVGRLAWHMLQVHVGYTGVNGTLLTLLEPHLHLLAVSVHEPQAIPYEENCMEEGGQVLLVELLIGIVHIVNCDDAAHVFNHKAPELNNLSQIVILPLEPTDSLHTSSAHTFQLCPHNVSSHTTGLPLPHSVAMAWEFRPDTYPYNAGVMLLHIPQLRRTYDAFLE